MAFFTGEKIGHLLVDVKPTIHRETHDIAVFRFIEGDPRGAEKPDFDDSDWTEFRIGSFWGGYDITAWFRAHVTIPPHLRDKKLALRFLVGPRDGGNSTAETMLYVNGEVLQAIDVWHEEAWLPPEHLQGESFFIALRAWSGVLGVPDRRRFKVAQLNWIDEGTEHFCAIAENLHKSLKELDKNDWRRVRLLEILNNAFIKISFIKPRSEEYYQSVENARQYLAEQVEQLAQLEDNKPTVIPLGHAHIDVGWLWRVSHSRHKTARTFATVLHYMRQYPEYHFMHTTPQLYEYLETDYPEIFERVREKIADGQWEITGGMWLEPDSNIPSGESLIRQILYGKRYIREKFGKETYSVWLPDIFGFSAALPQIIKKSGLKYLMTSKISWNQFNRFPYDTFYWRGPDGTELLTHFITTPEGEGGRTFTYNGTLLPHDVMGIWNNYTSKTINDELLMPFGWGDGGGGPTKEMIETARVMKNMPGFPKVKTDKLEPFFERLNARVQGKDVPVWDGELYLELHRGTYTSQANNKRANRKSEILYHDAEWMSALADLLTGESLYPDLSEGWKLIMLNQFHDILPGTSIRQVFEDSALEYERIKEIGTSALEGAQSRIAQNIRTEQASVIVFNSLPWPRLGLIEVQGEETLVAQSLVSNGSSARTQLVEENGEKKWLVEVQELVPSLGYATYALGAHGPAEASAMTIQPHVMESDIYRIMLNEVGQITSIWDKHEEREVLAPGARANVLQAFEDKPMKFDAWDIELFYQDKMLEVSDLVDIQVEEEGPLRGTLRLQWRFYDSVITQRISIYAHSRRIDFRTEIDWREQQVMLKAAFPVNIRSTRATYEIQFGTLERPTHWNTSWDTAKFEVCAHKWADLSEGNYGVALLNDCKYGYDIHNNVMRLTLLRSPILPDALADKGHHVFTYSLLPHSGSSGSSEIRREAYELNYPWRAELLPAQPNGTLPPSYSAAEGSYALIETIKRAEDDTAWVVRVYEPYGFRKHDAKIVFGHPIQRAIECNLVEEGESPVEFSDNEITFAITPFEIKTFKVWF